MDVASISPNALAPVANSGDDIRNLTSDFETFLKMLTTQLENQDPLNPMDTTEYATQLATFSGVEQQVKTNELLENLGQQFGQSGLSQMAGWVGMEARVSAPVQFQGQPITLYPQTATGSGRAELVVTTTSGTEIARHALGLGQAPVIWAGTGSNGAPLGNGNYNITVESFSGQDLLDSQSVQSYALVAEVKLVDGQPTVILPGGIEVSADQINGFRLPGS